MTSLCRRRSSSLRCVFIVVTSIHASRRHTGQDGNDNRRHTWDNAKREYSHSHSAVPYLLWRSTQPQTQLTLCLLLGKQAGLVFSISMPWHCFAINHTLTRCPPISLTRCPPTIKQLCSSDGDSTIPSHPCNSAVHVLPFASLR